MAARWDAPRRSALPLRRFRQPRTQAASKAAYTTTSMADWPDDWPEDVAARAVHGPMMWKKTGLPRHAAASMRSVAPLAGSTPDQAARVSQLASGGQSGSVVRNAAGFRLAASQRRFQSNGGAAGRPGFS